MLPATRVVNQDLLWSGARRRDSLTSGDRGTSPEECATADEIDAASREVERALDATHKAVAESRAATPGETETRKDTNELDGVQSGMRGEAFQDATLGPAEGAQGGAPYMGGWDNANATQRRF